MKQNEQSAQMGTSSTVYVIDPRRFGLDKFHFGCLLVFLLFWFPLTCIATSALFLGGPVFFLLIWVPGGWFGVITILGSIVKRYQKQVLTVVGNRLLISGTKLFSRKKVWFYRYELSALTLEFYFDGFDRESVYTLNLIQKPHVQPKRLILAPFANPDGKAILFDEIAYFLTSNGCTIQIKNDLTS